MKITEIFASIQGESTFCGLPCTFVRVTGCNLRCKYCDTPYALEGGEELKLDQILKRVGEAGIPLAEIKVMLDHPASKAVRILRKRLKNIQREIGLLRHQQRHVVHLLGCPELIKDTPMLSKDQWIEILRSSGLDDNGMDQWHREFEKSAPEAHRAFLESLGLTEQEVQEIRECYSQQVN